MMREHTRARERGATSAEYAGIIFVVIAIVVVLAGVVFSTSIGQTISCKIQEALGSDGACSAQGGDPTAPDASDVVVSSHNQDTSAGVEGDVKVGAGEIGGGVTDGGTFSREEHLDGTGRITSGGYVAVQVHGKLGDEVDAGEVEAAAELGLEGTGTYSWSDQWDCTTTGSGRDCDGFVAANQDAFDNRMKKGVDRFGSGNTEVNEVPDAKTTTVEGKLTLSASLGAEAEANDSFPEANLKVSANAEGGARQERTYSVTEDGKKGDLESTKTSFFYSLDVEASASLELFEAEIGKAEFEGYVGGQAAMGASEEFSYVRDADGNLTEVTFTTTTYTQGGVTAGVDGEKENKKGEDEGTSGGSGDGTGGTAYESTVTLDVTALSSEQRQVVEDYVNALNSKDPIFPASVVNPSQPVDADNALDTIIHENATVTLSSYATSTVSSEDTLDLWLVSYTSQTSIEDRRLTEQFYLGRPGADGVRPYIRNDGVQGP